MASTDARPAPIKGAAFRVTFPILDATGSLVTGAAGLDSEVSKDGGTFADCTNEATEIATNSGIYYLDLTASEMAADTVAVIVKTSTSGAKTTTLIFYPGSPHAVAKGTADSGSTTTMVDAARTEADTDYWKDAMIVFTSGNLAGQARHIISFDASTDTITFVPATTQAVSTHDYEIWPSGRKDIAMINGISIASNVAHLGVNVVNYVGSAAPALVGGRFDASVGAMAADVMTAAAAASDLTTELQTGLATAASIATLQADTDDIQTRLPAALVSGRIDASVGAMATDSVSSAAVSSAAANKVAAATWATDATGQQTQGTFGQAIGDPGATAKSIWTVANNVPDTGALTTVQADLDNIQTRLPAALVSGKMDASVTALGAGTITAASIASDAITAAKIASDVSAEIADAVWDEALSGHLSAGTAGNALDSAGDAGDPWGTILPGSYPNGTAGRILANSLDAPVSSRLAPTVAGRTLDVSAAGNAGLDLGNTENQGATLELAGTTVASVSNVALVQTLADGSIQPSTFAVSALAALADAVWDEAMAAHVVPGSSGEALANAASQGDPWAAPIPGGYQPGTAGDVIGNLVATLLSSPGAAAAAKPGATAGIQAKIDFLFAMVAQAWTHNRTDGHWGLRSADGLTEVAHYTTVDNGNTFTKGEMA